jgi:dolichyl-phosphate-mannose-protein mannosyltransferase
MADYLDAEKRVVGLALLTLVPFFNFHALKYNVNTVLMPTWAMTALWFLRSYRTRDAAYAALAGFGAALAMYGKYWSVFLIAGLVVAALADRRRAAYFRSPAPWITVAVGLVVLAPHLRWLVDNNFAPFSYAMTVHGEKTFAVAAMSTLGYLAGSLGYVALPLVIVLAMARRPAVLTDAAWPHDDDRRLAAAAFWAPLLLPVIAGIAGTTEITSLWSMSAWTLLPVVLLSPPALSIRPIDTERLLGLAIAVPLVVLVASPAIAWFTRDKGQPAEANAKSLARAVDDIWRTLTPNRLRFVGGDPTLIDGVVTWSSDRPKRISELAAKNFGVAYVCYGADVQCLTASRNSAKDLPGGPAAILNKSVVIRARGRDQTYVIISVIPVSE